MSTKAIKRTKRAPLIQFISGIIFILFSLSLYFVPKYFLYSPSTLRAQQSVFPNYKKDKPVLVEITYISDYIATSTDDKGEEYVYYFAQVPNYDVAIIEVSKADAEKFNNLTPPQDFVGMPVNSSEVGMADILSDAITHYRLEDDGPIWDNTLDYFISKVEFERYTSPNWIPIIFLGITGFLLLLGAFTTRRANKKLESELVNQFQSVNSIQDFMDKADYRNGTIGIYIKDSTMVTSGDIYQSVDLNKIHSLGHQLMVRRGRYNYVSFIDAIGTDGRTEMTIRGKKKDIQASLPDFYRYIVTHFPNIVLPDEVLVAIGYPASGEKPAPAEPLVVSQEVEETEPVQEDAYVEEEVLETNYVEEDADNASDDYVSPFDNKNSDTE
ncbi:hypothetical protein [Granulicatella seriolae]|uniref:DUF3592 domain-containing protein n=1 Tax=Granulicatella seriolae TaxID=2967226 RepID=A0ABT1WLV0_9LACT|nr:hypothetical protein [Granulicatella seriolae]